MLRAEKFPTEGRLVAASSVFRYPVVPKARMLMMAPEMIWSARTLIESHA